MVIQRVLASARVAPLPRNSSVHSSHSSVSLALDIFISPGFLKCRVTHLIAGDLWLTFIVDGCHDHLYFLLNFQARHRVLRGNKIVKFY